MNNLNQFIEERVRDFEEEKPHHQGGHSTWDTDFFRSFAQDLLAEVGREISEALRKYEFQYVISGEEISMSNIGNLAKIKEYTERKNFSDLGLKIREEGMFRKGYPKSPIPDTIVKQVTVLVADPEIMKIFTLDDIKALLKK
jgi:hypothetical protein